jgi:hypothetical protein
MWTHLRCSSLKHSKNRPCAGLRCTPHNSHDMDDSAHLLKTCQIRSRPRRFGSRCLETFQRYRPDSLWLNWSKFHSLRHKCRKSWSLHSRNSRCWDSLQSTSPGRGTSRCRNPCRYCSCQHTFCSWARSPGRPLKLSRRTNRCHKWRRTRTCCPSGRLWRHTSGSCCCWLRHIPRSRRGKLCRPQKPIGRSQRNTCAHRDRLPDCESQRKLCKLGQKSKIRSNRGTQPGRC